jgi:hypothetical protein
MKTMTTTAGLRRLAAGAALLAAAALAQAQSALPPRNLLVELRQSDEASLQRERTGATGGDVVIGSDGRVSGGVTIGAQTRSRDAAGDSVQHLRVLNGGRGSLRLARVEPLEFLQVWWTPQGVQAMPSTVWAETGRGFVVQPRWPGGAAPVTVEVSAEGGSGTGGAERSQLLTTLQLPMGEWVTIASSAATRSSERSGVATRDIGTRRSAFVVQMRVTAP